MSAKRSVGAISAGYSRFMVSQPAPVWHLPLLGFIQVWLGTGFYRAVTRAGHVVERRLWRALGALQFDLRLRVGARGSKLLAHLESRAAGSHVGTGGDSTPDRGPLRGRRNRTVDARSVAMGIADPGPLCSVPGGGVDPRSHEASRAPRCGSGGPDRAAYDGTARPSNVGTTGRS